MSRENVELVRAALFGADVDLVPLARAGNLDRAIDAAAFAPDVEVFFATPSGPLTPYRGLDGLVAGWRDWLIPWTSYAVDIEELVDAGERVVALGTLRGRTQHDGVEVQQPGAAVATVSDGKIVRLEFHLDHRGALESAGVSA
jgi:ketosteroid isomerase-like protein